MHYIKSKIFGHKKTRNSWMQDLMKTIRISKFVNSQQKQVHCIKQPAEKKIINVVFFYEFDLLIKNKEANNQQKDLLLSHIMELHGW